VIGGGGIKTEWRGRFSNGKYRCTFKAAGPEGEGEGRKVGKKRDWRETVNGGEEPGLNTIQEEKGINQLFNPRLAKELGRVTTCDVHAHRAPRHFRA